VIFFISTQVDIHSPFGAFVTPCIISPQKKSIGKKINKKIKTLFLLISKAKIEKVDKKERILYTAFGCKA